MTKMLHRCHDFWRLLSCICLLYAGSSLQAQATSPGGRKVTISIQNGTINDAFKGIQKQTGLLFTYSNDQFDQRRKITLQVNNSPLDEVLQTCLQGTDFTWYYKDNIIVIIRKADRQIKKSEINIAEELLDTVIILRGIVTDENGAPLPGANISLRGSTRGTKTDISGKFILRDVPTKAVVSISNVGYLSQEIKISKESNVLSIRLKEYISSLDETVVIAYATTTRRISTGNISTVKAEDIAKQPVNNPLLALQGRVPGLVIEQATGIPGSGVQVRIQGQNSITKGNDPLYVIDGVPYMSQLPPTLNAVLGSSGGVAVNGLDNGGGNPLSFINPADIESMDVLKDADATAIYGSRAANGAILITTKKGKAGPTRFNVNMQNGWGQVTRKMDVLNRQQYLEMRHEAKRNDNVPILSTDYDINGTWDTTRSNDWQKELIGETARYTDVQASVAGGERNTQFLVGAGYHKETTVFPGDYNDQKGSLHLNINNVSANKKFRLQVSGSYMVDNNNIVAHDLTVNAVNLAPVAPSLYNADGSLNWAPNASGNSTWTNPLAFLNNKYNVKTNNLTSNMQVSYEVIPGLEIKSSFGYNNMQTREYLAIHLQSVAPEQRPFRLRTSMFGNSTSYSQIIEPQISYKRSIKKGRLEVLLGSTIQQNTSNVQQISGVGYSSDQMMENILSAPNVSVAFADATSYKYSAVFGRINYNWQNKYIMNLVARRDGSSRFGREKQFHTFGSIGGAWIFSSETFMQKVAPFLSFGKLRGSYGTTGSDQIGDYQFLNRYSSNNVPFSYQGVIGLLPDGLPNPHLAWEETRKMQLGLDLGFFADKALLNINYFCNRSSNQLLGYNLPITTGFGSVLTNFPATVQNSGWELSLNTKNITTKNFSWTSNINLTLPKNRLVKFPNLAGSTYASALIIGQSITIIKRYHFLEVNPTTGLYEVADSHGKPTSSPNIFTDRTALANLSLPKFYGGFQNSFSYKGFQMDLLFQFVKQISDFPITGFSSRPGRFAGTSNVGNQPASVLQRWQKPGDNKPIQKFSSTYPGQTLSAYRAGSGSDANIVDGSYIRLKNLSLSWQLPTLWLQKTHLQNCRLYVQGQNLLTISNYPGMDPETRSSLTLPPLRVLTLGAQLTL